MPKYSIISPKEAYQDQKKMFSDMSKKGFKKIRNLEMRIIKSGQKTRSFFQKYMDRK